MPHTLHEYVGNVGVGEFLEAHKFEVSPRNYFQQHFIADKSY